MSKPLGSMQTAAVAMTGLLAVTLASNQFNNAQATYESREAVITDMVDHAVANFTRRAKAGDPAFTYSKCNIVTMDIGQHYVDAVWLKALNEPAGCTSTRLKCARM